MSQFININCIQGRDTAVISMLIPSFTVQTYFMKLIGGMVAVLSNWSGISRFLPLYTLRILYLVVRLDNGMAMTVELYRLANFSPSP